MHTKKYQVHYHYESLVEPKKIETVNILIYKKSYKYLMIYFTRYHPHKSLTVLNVYYVE